MTNSERASKWNREHPERRKEIERAYRQRNPRTSYFQSYYHSHKSDYQRRKREWEKNNRAKCSAQVGRRLIRDRLALKNWYVRRLLSYGSFVPPAMWPVGLVDLKRVELKVKRIWQHRKTSPNYATNS